MGKDWWCVACVAEHPEEVEVHKFKVEAKRKARYSAEKMRARDSAAEKAAMLDAMAAKVEACLEGIRDCLAEFRTYNKRPELPVGNQARLKGRLLLMLDELGGEE